MNISIKNIVHIILYICNYISLKQVCVVLLEICIFLEIPVPTIILNNNSIIYNLKAKK